MPKLKANGIEIDYSINGEGNPLVLIAGLGYGKWCWHRVVPELSKKYKVIIFDNRGVGGTTRTEGAYSAQLLANDTYELLMALGIKKAAIVGISMGGFIAQSLAIAHPEVFSHLILMCTSVGGALHVPPSESVLKKIVERSVDIRGAISLSVSEKFMESEPKFIDEWVKYRAENPIHPEGYKSQLAIGLSLYEPGNSFEQGMKKFSGKTLIINGEKDEVVPFENAYTLANLIPNSEIIILPDAGHFLPIEQPIRIQSLISDFLEKN